jgi:hypothetical protein
MLVYAWEYTGVNITPRKYPVQRIDSSESGSLIPTTGETAQAENQAEESSESEGLRPK